MGKKSLSRGEKFAACGRKVEIKLLFLKTELLFLKTKPLVVKTKLLFELYSHTLRKILKNARKREDMEIHANIALFSGKSKS